MRSPAAPQAARPLAPDLELREVRKGSRPGSRYVRLAPRSERAFQRLEGGYRATDVAIRPRSPAERVWRAFKRLLVGAPLASSQIEEQKIPKLKALAVFSSDALSSSAYATDEILLVLIAAGTGALTHSIEIALAVGLLLAIVAFSYRQTIRAYPNGGGAYIVARENLGDAAGIGAAAALSVDYILTVAVSIAAGVFAITSAFPELGQVRVEIAGRDSRALQRLPPVEARCAARPEDLLLDERTAGCGLARVAVEVPAKSGEIEAGRVEPICRSELAPLGTVHAPRGRTGVCPLIQARREGRCKVGHQPAIGV